MTAPGTTVIDAAAADVLSRAMDRHCAGDPAAAVFYYRQALALCPAVAPIHHALGIVLLATGRFDDAITAARRAIILVRDLGPAYDTLAHALRGAGQGRDALRPYRQAITLGVMFPETYGGLGTALFEAEAFGPAALAYRRAMRLDPEQALAAFNLGNAWQALEQIGRALRAYRHAIALQPDYHEAWSNLGSALKALGRVDEAIAAYRRGLVVRPDSRRLHVNMALALLQRGDFQAGWAHYEWRWRGAAFRAWRPASSAPDWDGGPLAGRTLLLFCEQGFGDALQFVRFAPLAAARGGRVLLRTDPALAGLLARVSGIDQVIPYGAPLPSFDVQLPLLSLPRLFGTDLDSIPAAVPYLSADPAAVAVWRQRLAAIPGLKVGLVWAGDPRRFDRDTARVDRQRSLRLDDFAGLAQIPGITLVSLQKGDAAGQAATPQAGLALIDWTAALGNFADTASLVAALDLVITVDTAVAHLAGGLGKAVWILSRFDGCWRWLRHRDDSPWYPTARLFRQQRPGDWVTVLGRVRQALAAFPRQDGRDATTANVVPGAGPGAELSGEGSASDENRAIPLIGAVAAGSDD
ncbi:MAG: tetratricopeptide repeat-containing glycosyltransferase family protein [Azospirillaceae bacterium]|nr:tetratricopeptide repeat-containing glycosyltransferase family protein [Azospirillaceae bacterium]